jgi:hypothetical protein
VKRYRGADGPSGVVAYEAGEDWIKVKFVDGGIYLYDHATPGRDEVEAMKLLAASGRDLATFINKYVRERYAKKLR